MKLLGLFCLIVIVTGQDLEFGGDSQADSSSLFIQSVRPRTHQSVVEDEVQRVKKLIMEVVPPKVDHSYWVPYSDRTVTALSFPVLTHELFTPVVLQPGEEIVKPKLVKLKVKKPKSDIGVVISRNSILRENFRDHAQLNRKNVDTKYPADQLLIEAAKAFSQVQLARRPLNAIKTDKLLGTSSITNFVMVGLETRVKYPRSADAKHFGSFGNGEIFRNGTVSFPSARHSSVLVHIPFYFRNAGDIDHVFDNYDDESGNLVPQEKTEIKAFLKMVYGMHDDQFGDGDEAVQRILRRTRSLKRPSFRIPVESNNTLVQQKLEKQRLDEEKGKNVVWIYSNTVAMRTLSSPMYVQHLVPVAPVVVNKKPVITVVPEPVILKKEAPLIAKEVPLVHKENHLIIKEAPVLVQKEVPVIQKEVPLAVPLIQKEAHPPVPLIQSQLEYQKHFQQYRIPVIPQNLQFNVDTHPVVPQFFVPQDVQQQQTFHHVQNPQYILNVPIASNVHQIKK